VRHDSAKLEQLWTKREAQCGLALGRSSTLIVGGCPLEAGASPLAEAARAAVVAAAGADADADADADAGAVADAVAGVGRGGGEGEKIGCPFLANHP
jgi:hypothetical protein